MQKISMQGECIHYFYRKNSEPKEESPGISMTTPEKPQHQNISEAVTCKSSLKSLTADGSHVLPTNFDKNSFNLQLRGVVSIAIWLQGQRAVTNFIPLDNRWTALIRIYLGTIEDIGTGFPGSFSFGSIFTR